MHQYQLTETHDINVAKTGDKRTFNGIANSGKPFVYHGERVIADLSDISFADKAPALLLHDRSQRVGFGVLTVKDNQLLITGELLNNEHGKQVADEADAGFPWQMSAHITASYVEKLTHNQTATVNGQEITGEISILRGCRVSEISFTPTGVDNQTVAHVLSDPFNPNPSQQENPMNEIDTLKTQVAELTKQIAEQKAQIDELTAKNKTLEEEKAKAETEAKKADIDAQLSAKGFTKDDKGVWQVIESATLDVLLSLDGDKAKAVIGNLSAPKKGVPDFLLGETYGGGDGQPNTKEQSLADMAKARKA